MKFQRILVPLDGSAPAEAALWKAAGLTDGATLCLIRVAEAHAPSGADAINTRVLAVHEAEEYLASIVAQLRSRGITRVEARVWCGPPAAAIVEAAQAQPVDLIVMSTHGRSGLGRLVLGSVAESVLRGTRTPILLVRAEGAPIEPLGSAAPATESRRG